MTLFGKMFPMEIVGIKIFYWRMVGTRRYEFLRDSLLWYRRAIEPSMLVETIQYLLLLRLEMPDACLTVFLYRFLNTDRWAGSNSRQRAGK